MATPWVGDAERLEDAFQSRHRGLYGFTLDVPVECVTLQVEAVGEVSQPTRETVAPGSGARAAGRQRMHLDGGTSDVPVYERASLGAGDSFDGPAIVTQLDATTLVRDGWRAQADARGALLLIDKSGNFSP